MSKQKPKVTFVEDEDVIYEGEPLNPERIAAIVDDVHAELRAKRLANLQPGGKSLTLPGVHSPVIQYRVPAEVRVLAETIAEREGVSLSKLSRRALDEYLERHAG